MSVDFIINKLMPYIMTPIPVAVMLVITAFYAVLLRSIYDKLYSIIKRDYDYRIEELEGQKRGLEIDNKRLIEINAKLEAENSLLIQNSKGVKSFKS